MPDVFSLQIPYLYLLHVVMVGVRAGAMLMFSPIWGNPAIPLHVRVLLVFVSAASIAPVIPFDQQAFSQPMLFIPGEFFVGLLLGMGIRIAFAVLHFAGHLVGFSIGFSAVSAIDPLTQNRSTLMSGFFTMMGYVIFLGMNQHHEFLRAMKASYQAFPMGTVPPVSSWFELLVTTSSNIFSIGWKIGFPLFVVILLADVAVGFLARLQPQFNAIVLAMPIKVLVGLFMLGATLMVFPAIVREISEFVVLGG